MQTKRIEGELGGRGERERIREGKEKEVIAIYYYYYYYYKIIVHITAEQ